MNIITRNKKAKKDGIIFEYKAKQYLKQQNIKFIEIFKTIDLFIKLNGKYYPLEIKGALKYHRNGKTKTKGRFKLENKQHNFLIKHNGFYLFILKDNNNYKFKLVKANDIKFKNKISWKYIFT